MWRGTIAARAAEAASRRRARAEPCVVVAARNEADRIGATLDALARGLPGRARSGSPTTPRPTPRPRSRCAHGAEVVTRGRPHGKGGERDRRAARRARRRAERARASSCSATATSASPRGGSRRWSRRSSAGDCDLAVAVFARRVGGGLRARARLRALGDPARCGSRRAGADLRPARDAAPTSCATCCPFAAGFGMEIGMTSTRSAPGTGCARSSSTSSTARPAARSAASPTAARQLRDFRARRAPPRGARIALRAVILAIDQGTTGTTCLVFDARARSPGRAYSEFEQHFPRPGWVEHDADEIWDVTRARRRGGARRRRDRRARDLAGIGITNQRETVVAWDPRHAASRSTARSSGRTAAPPTRCDELQRGGPRGPRPRAHRARHRPLLLRHQDRVAAAQRRRLRAAPSSARSTPGSSSSSPGAT